MTNPESQSNQSPEQKTRSQKDLDNWLAYSALVGIPRVMGPRVREYPYTMSDEEPVAETESSRQIRFSSDGDPSTRRLEIDEA